MVKERLLKNNRNASKENTIVNSLQSLRLLISRHKVFKETHVVFREKTKVLHLIL